MNAFYDLVQRHNEAVGAGNWSQPFPLEAAKVFFGVVDENTPRLFEPEVGHGLHRVEQAEPPAAAAEPRASPPSAIQPPPLPPGAPDAEHSWQRQMATSINALWETFLRGRNLPLNSTAWREVAEKLGENARPVLDFLRALDVPKGADLKVVTSQAAERRAPMVPPTTDPADA